MTQIPTPTDVDELIRQNRAATPRAAVEARKVPRATIKELNELDIDEIRDRYVRTGYDDRSPVTKVLDLVDLPRNVVANIVFRGTGAVESEGLRRGAAGLPVVNTSDALKNLGVSNRVIRGVLGFVGDVALDPLTFLGPAGWGLQVADKAGRGVRIGAAGARGLKRGLKEVSAGQVIRHQPTRELFDTLLANAPDEIKAADNARKAAYLSEKALGKVGAQSKAGTPFYFLSRSLGGDRQARGGAIAELLTKEGAEADAVRQFVSRAGSAAGPGIGKGGSQVAHIPFTDISVKTPGFTRAGRAAEEDLAIARSAAPRDISEYVSPTVTRASQLAREIDQIEASGGDSSELFAELNNLVGRHEADPITPKSEREIFQLQKLIDEADASIASAKARVGGFHNNAFTGVEDADDVIDSLDDASRESLAESAQNAVRAYERYRGSIIGSVRNFAQATPQEDMLYRAAMRFLGTDDPIVGRAAFAGPDAMLRAVRAPDAVNDLAGKAYRTKTKVFGERGSALNEAERAYRHAMGPGQRRAVNTYLGEAIGGLRKAFSDLDISPSMDDLDEATTLLTALAVRQQAQRAASALGEGVYYTHRFGSETELAPYLMHIERAVKSGKLSKQLSGGLLQKLEQVAEQYGANLLDELQRIEQGAGLLASPRAGYFPNVATPAAKQAMRSSKAYQGAQQGSRTTSAAIGEAFQKPRSFDQVRWKSEDGTWKRLFRVDEQLVNRFKNNPQELQGLRIEGYGDVADEYEKLIADYDEFLSLKNPPAWHNTDPFEMNDLAKQGRFSMLLDGVDPVGGFMQTNMLAAMANRIGSHERAMARAQWRAFVDQYRLKLPGFDRATANKDILTAPDGSQARIVNLYTERGAPVKGAIVGGQPYRPLQGVNPTNPMYEMMGPESARDIYHERAAAAIERMAKVLDDPNPVLDGINALTRQWKNLTLLHPSWTIFNLIGDTLNALQGGVNPKFMFDPESAKFAINLQRYADKPEKLRNMTINVRGVPVTGEQILNDLVDQKVIDGTMMDEMVLKMVENKIFTMPSQASGRLGRLRPAVLLSDFKDAAQRTMLARRAERLSATDKLKAAGSVVSDRYLNNFLGPWFRANQKVSNFIRSQTYLSYLNDGFSPSAAARKVIESQFDYSDATRVEAEMFRTLFPFYSWMRNNGAYQIKRLLDRPGYAAAFPKVQQAIEEAIAGDEKVPLQQRPTWMRNSLALQVGSDPEKRSALLFGGALPAADVYQYLTPILGVEGIQDFLKYFASGLNPILNAPLQLGTGQETFTGKTIGPDPYSGDVAAGDFLLNQIRPIAELRPGGKLSRAFERSTGEGIGRAILGGRFQDMSEDRLRTSRLREFKDVERRIRQSIARDERQGNPSVAGRSKLMELYAAMEDSGFADEVPKWARGQLQELG